MFNAVSAGWVDVLIEVKVRKGRKDGSLLYLL